MGRLHRAAHSRLTPQTDPTKVLSDCARIKLRQQKWDAPEQLSSHSLVAFFKKTSLELTLVSGGSSMEALGVKVQVNDATQFYLNDNFLA